MDRISKWLNEEVGCSYSRTTDGYSNVPDSALRELLAIKDSFEKLLPVFLLGATEKHEAWGARQIIAAESPEQATSMAHWDYRDETQFCEYLDAVWADGPARVLFETNGD